MADSGIKKYRQKYNDLPPISSITEGYSIRYRVISEDKNRISHWSPSFLVIPNFTYVKGEITVDSANQTAYVTWDPVVVLKNKKTVSDITTKSLTSDVATLTTSSPHYISIGDWITVSGVGAPFNGTYKINAVTGTTFSYYRHNGNILSSPVNPPGTYIINSEVGNALSYDIWIRWDKNDGGDWVYKERVQTTSVSYSHSEFYTKNNVIQSSAPNSFTAAIYLVGNPIREAEFLKMYESDPKAI